MSVRRGLVRLLRLRNLALVTAAAGLLLVLRALAGLEPAPAALQPAPAARAPLLPLGEIHDTLPTFQLTSKRKKDWHNYTQINYEKSRVGPGEQGRPARLPPGAAELEERLYAVNGFNGALSDIIPLNRSLPDIRHPKCRDRQYFASLPSVSVVVPFHNEHWSTLLRTAHAALHRAPPGLVREVFLVDDASTKEFLGSELEEYLARHMPAVRVVRLAARRGLIAARLAGARRAAGDVLVFLDSHTEPNVNWLPPLLDPIAADWRTVVCPYIDVIAYDTFEYRAQDEGARGAFDWEFFYKRLPLLPRDLANMPDPFPSPVMAGGLFAISRAFFWELGGYDPGLDIWGGEQYELSFKVWQCGGRMLDAPCSRVGHIYRKFAPFPNPNHGDFVGKNYRRVAEVWMDEYAAHLYARRPHYARLAPGDLSQQKALRARLRCKPFKWFLTQIAFDLTAKYPPVEPRPFATGTVRAAGAGAGAGAGSGEQGEWCVDAHHGAQMDKLQLRRCHLATEKEFTFSWHKDVKSSSRNMCWDLPEAAPRSPVRLYACHLGGGNQLWRYLPETQQIRHGQAADCLEYSLEPPGVYINPCAGSASQRWRVQHLDQEMMARWDEMQERVTGPLEPWRE